MLREYALVMLVTAAVTYLLVPLVRRVAIATHAAHMPRARDMHTEPVPLLGGLAMYGGLIAGLLIASRLKNLQDPFQYAGSRTQTGLLLAGALIVLIGYADDRWGLGAFSKLAGQIAVAGVVVWSGQSLPWLPKPNGHVLLLEPDLSVTLTILIIVVTINAINFIDGLDGLAAGVVGVAAVSFLIYSNTLDNTLQTPSLSLPAVSSALLAGMCIGFLPHNFHPARIFMGDIGAMLLGLLLAYGPISSTNSFDPALLITYNRTAGHLPDRFSTLLPLLVPAAIFLIPYTDLMMAVIRRTRRGMSPMAADREHLHHRLLGIGHSYRQSVLIMWLWAALFSGILVSLSLARTHSGILAIATVIAALTLLPVTMPGLRPWRWRAKPSAMGAGSTPVSASAGGGSVGVGPAGAGPAGVAGSGADAGRARHRAAPTAGGGAPTTGNGAPLADSGAGRGRGNGGPPPGFEPIPAPTGNASLSGLASRRGSGPFTVPGRGPGADSVEHGSRPFPGDTGPAAWPAPDQHNVPNPFAADSAGGAGPFGATGPFGGPGQLGGAGPFNGPGQFGGAAPFGDAAPFDDAAPFGDAPFGAPGHPSLPNSGPLPDDDRFADTDPFPASPHPGPPQH
jgi:UDP-GlcNAc:undecaprenyl-phosphate/decaprenyl-phosphate GlcNAc-1-phosphate transferase